MPKSNAKLARKYKENYEVLWKSHEILKKSHEEIYKKNLKHIETNGLFHLAEQKWRKQNSYLLQENSLEVSKVMKLTKSLEDKDKEIIDLKKEIKYLKEKLCQEEIRQMKEEIPSDF